MTKPKGIFKRRKNVGKSKITVVVSPSPSKLLSSQTQPRPTSSSKRKLSDLESNYKPFLNEHDSCNDIVDLNRFTSKVFSFSCCKHCGQDLKFSIEKRLGLATTCVFTCSGCKLNESFTNSGIYKCIDSSVNKQSPIFELNVRLVYALRCIGKGQSVAPVLCALLNLPRPPTRFERYVNILCPAVKSISEETMSDAISEAVTENGESKDLAIGVDGSWQRRGHLSLNGIVSVTSIDTGKVLDVEIMSKYCTCKNRLKKEHEENCKANYYGTSGGMELAGAKSVFSRSLDRGVRYKTYLGDGDSKAFTTVANEKPYGPDFIIEKIECVGHVQKRMGSRLLRLKNKSKQLKLSDGKGLGGKNRLTDDKILLIQKYYGLAIRRNPGSLEDMRKAVWAGYFHLCSSNERPQHGLCPNGSESWCKYNKAIAQNQTYDHSKHTHLPEVIMEHIKPIFRDLASPDLLSKCLHGKSQNVNESLNNVIWNRLPKTVFVGLHTLTLGVHDAVSCFNRGYITRCEVLKKLGFEVGRNCAEVFMNIDKVRVRKAEKATEAIQKEARQKKALAKRKLEEELIDIEDPDNPPYASGHY